MAECPLLALSGHPCAPHMSAFDAKRTCVGVPHQGPAINIDCVTQLIQGHPRSRIQSTYRSCLRRQQKARRKASLSVKMEGIMLQTFKDWPNATVAAMCVGLLRFF